MTERQRTSPIKNFVSGGVGGVFTCIAGHPMDTIKVRLQTMPTVGPGQVPLYRGTWDCLKQTVVKESFWALYKGMGAPVAAVSPAFAISFFGFSVGRKIQQRNPDEVLTLPKIAAAGAVAACFTTTIAPPIERIKCILQIQQGLSEPPKYKGPIHCGRKIFQQEGIKGLYRGTCATLLRDIPSVAVFFMTYEWMKRLLTPSGEQPGKLSVIRTITAGGTAGVLSWLVCIPADVLKSRLQTAPEGTYPNGVRDVFRQLMKTQGYTALYRGCIPILIRAFPANGACFVGYETTMSLLNWAMPHL